MTKGTFHSLYEIMKSDSEIVSLLVMVLLC